MKTKKTTNSTVQMHRAVIDIADILSFACEWLEYMKLLLDRVADTEQAQYRGDSFTVVQTEGVRNIQAVHCRNSQAVLFCDRACKARETILSGHGQFTAV